MPTRADPTLAAEWREILGSLHLHRRFVDRYAATFARLRQDADEGAHMLIVHGLRQTVGWAIRNTGLGVPVLDKVQAPRRGRPPTGDAGVLAMLTGSIEEADELETFLNRQQWLETSRVPIAADRDARFVATNNGHALCAVRWSVDSLQARRRNASELLRLVQSLEPSEAHVRVEDRYALVAVSARDLVAVSPFLGTTLEDALRDDVLTTSERASVVSTLAELRAAMVETRRIWQGFAPRNMFFRDGNLTLIDFEEVSESRDLLLWHEVFFADCLTTDERAQLFGDGSIWLEPDDGEVVPDAFERIYYGAAAITRRQRASLLARTLRLESRHTRPDGATIFGHELGHFWGDFLDVESQVQLHRILEALDDTLLVPCLEALEAAMDADVTTLCLAREGARLGPPLRRTRALLACLEDAGPEAVASERNALDTWYETLRDDPWLLVETVADRARTTRLSRLGAPVERYFIGDPVFDDDHLETLTRGLRIGIKAKDVHAPEGFARFADAEALAQLAERGLPRSTTSIDDLLAELAEVVVPLSVNQAHGTYFAFPDSGNSVAAVLGGVVSKLLNQNLIAVDRSAPIATFIEIQVIEWLRELVGYEAAPPGALQGVGESAGLWMPGGHLSNHTAMLAALGATFPEARHGGLRSLPRNPVVVLAGAIAHYSHSDSAFHLGLGWSAVRGAGASADFTTNPADVAAVLDGLPDDEQPFMVVAVAGNCRTTSLDAIEPLADLCESRGIWLHVDACHGGALLFSERLRARYLRGIERANSVSLDPHKGLFTPYPSSYVLFRDRGVLRQFSRHETAVNDPAMWDLGLVTPFLGSRGFESLATWLLLRHVGVDLLGAVVEARQRLTRRLEQRLWDSGLFVCLNDVDFYRLAFVYCPATVRDLLRSCPPESAPRIAKVISAYSSKLGRLLYESAAICIDEHTLADLGDRVGLGSNVTYSVLAACPGNPLLEDADVEGAIAVLTEVAAELRPAFEAEVLHASNGVTSSDYRGRIAGPAGWSDEG